ncbi:MAG: hypothetical protein HYZ75_00605 [Elusimicrobia bacterium]|nr:hypothetical protein [Elusimicrobiota bacterium]
MRLLPLLLLLWAPARAADIDYVQRDWSAGAASASTTSVQSGWTAYDSQDGNVVSLSTAIRSLTGIPRVWLQTDDGGGDAGFARAGSLLSSTTLQGSGTGAFLSLALQESVVVRAAQLPQARELTAAAYHPQTKRIYLFGGRKADGTLTNEVLEYDPVADSVAVSADALPTARAGTSAAYDPATNKIYVFGGFDSGGFAQAQIIKYDPIAHSVQSSVGLLPTARSHTSAAYVSSTGRIYVFGGMQFGVGVHLASIVDFDPTSEAVVNVATTLPSGRIETAAAFDPASGDVLVFGGNATGTYLNDVVAFHPAGSSTTLLSPLPGPMAALTAARHPFSGRIYLYGGENAGTPSAQVLEYDPGPRTVAARGPVLPAARARAAAAVDTDRLRLFVFGGTGTAAGFSDVLENILIASGVYQSSVFDTGNLSLLGAADWTPAVQADTSTALGLSFRAGNVATPGPTWSNGGAFAAFANGASLTALGATRYLQYSATFTTVNVATSPALSDVSIAYGQTAPSGTLTSSAFDSGRDGNVLRRLRWNGSFQPGTTSQFQLRTAPSDGSGQPGTWTAWLGPVSATDSYRDPDGGETVNPSHSDGLLDRFFQYRAVLITSGTVIPAAISTVTLTVNSLPAAPSATALVALSTAELSLTLTDGSDNETDFVVSSGTLPGALNLGASTPTASSAGVGGSQAITITGLNPNTAYFVRLRARNTPDGLLSAFSNELNAFTLANAPSALSADAVFLASATLSWSSAGNPGNTPYEVTASTDGFAADVSTPVAFADGLTATTTDILSLAAGTTYSFRVRALNGNAIPSPFSVVFTTVTVPAPLSGLAGSALGTSSITWTWDTSGPAARYRVHAAADGTQLADAAASSFTLTGLSTNTAFGIRVRPYDSSAEGALSAAATVFTQAAVPAGFTASGLSTGTIALSWAAGGNPAGTRYEVSLSTVGFPLAVSTPVALGAGFTATATTFIGLAAGTSHFVRVRAFNGDSVGSIFALASTQTLPGALGAPAGAALGVSSLSWTWNSTAGPAVTGYAVIRASDGVVIATTAAAAFVETSLSTDTPFGLSLRAIGGTGLGALSAATTVFTLAAPPTASALAAVFVDSVTLSWSANGNPGRTVYLVERSTPGGAFLQVTAGTGTLGVIVNLLADTTYSLRVRAANGDGLTTDYDAALSTFIAGRLPQRVSAFLAVPVGGARIRLSWGISPSTTAARYELFSDSATGTVDYGVLLASTAASATTYTSAPLTPDATYTFGIRVVDERGISEKNVDVLAAALALSTGSPLSTFIRSPPGGAKVWGDRLTVAAGVAAGSAGEVRRVAFQFRSSSAAPWADMAAAEAARPNPAVDAPFTTLWDVTTLTPGRYQVRAVARDASGTDDAAPPVGTVLVDPTDPDQQATRLSSGRVLTRVKVYRAAPAAAEATDPDEAFTTRVALATACVAAESDVLRIDGAPAAVPLVPSSFSASGIFRDVSLESGQAVLTNGRCATLSFGRLDVDGDRRVDGTETRSDNLLIAFFDPLTGRWRFDFPSVFTQDDGGTLTGASSHFTLFALLSPAAADLGTLRVYPVPWRPNNADTDDGKAWSAGDPTSGIIFDNLPPESRLSIYTVAGSLVWEAPGPAQGGLRRWDGRNGDGRDAASGVYFLVVTGPDGNTRVEKLAVIR